MIENAFGWYMLYRRNINSQQHKQRKKNKNCQAHRLQRSLWLRWQISLNKQSLKIIPTGFKTPRRKSLCREHKLPGGAQPCFDTLLVCYLCWCPPARWSIWTETKAPGETLKCVSVCKWRHLCCVVRVCASTCVLVAPWSIVTGCDLAVLSLRPSGSETLHTSRHLGEE